MSDSVALPVMENGFGGAGMGAGFIGGLVLGSIWNGGWGGWGNNGRGAMQAGADVALANAVEHVGDQVNQGTISQLQSANQLGLQIANSNANTVGAVNQNTIAGMQGTAQLAQQMCCSTGRLSQEIDQTGDMTVAAINQANIQAMQNTQALGEKLCGINNNITSQGYENRLQAQALASQLQQQHAQLSAQISDGNCKDRELMREIAAQNVRDQLAQAQAQNAALVAQINLQSQLQQQTLYLVDQLKPAATTTAGA